MRVDRPVDPNCVNLAEVLSTFNLVQHISEPTHELGGLLDLLITFPGTDVDVTNTWNGISDHCALTASIAFSVRTLVDVPLTSCRSWRNFDKNKFESDLLKCDIFNCVDVRDSLSLDELFSLYQSTVITCLDNHAPVIQRKRFSRPLTPWFDDVCRQAKRRARTLERRYRKTRLVVDQQNWRQALRSSSLLYQVKSDHFWKCKIDGCSGKPSLLWKSMNTMLGRGTCSAGIPDSFSPAQFSEFFKTKIDDIAKSTSTSPAAVIVSTATTDLSAFSAVSVQDMETLILESPSTSCSLDPAPTWLVKECHHTFAVVLAYLVSRSFDESYFPTSQKAALVRPLLKKPTLDKYELKNYRPISNLSYTSKLLERAASRQLTQYLETNRLLPRHQSAYRAFHSTETAVLKVYSDVVDAIDGGDVVLLGMLDLSTAFDTADHDILMERLCRTHGIQDKALFWIQLYLSNHM